MKTIFTFLFCTLFVFSSFAVDDTRITISSISNNKLQVEVDGRRYQMNDKGISIRDLRSGYHTVKIYREQKKNNRIWNFGNGNKKQETIYNSRVYLKVGHHFDILVNRFGKVMVDERRIDRNDDWYDEADDDRYNDDRDRNRENRNSRDNRYDNNNNNRVMSDQEFIRAKESLQREWFENKRMATAMQLFDRNYFLSRQVKELLQLFNSENNKLDLAKYAYGRTTDQSVYYIINDVFAFSSSREELARYIRDYR
ncbi:MAG TPA: DUF4476 domain-containing protein [Chitinophagaceae bacterium]|nr:DUF4476 domain-containing protein [Chitinophagaceae bacterium]